MGYQLQYISTTNGAFDSVLAANITATSVVESKFLITSFYNGRPVWFGVDYADTVVRAYEKDMYMYPVTTVNVSSYLTLNEEHTAYFSSTEYRWNGSKIADVTGTVAIPSSPRFRSQIMGNFYDFKITDNGVDLVNLVAWDEDGTLGIKDLVSGNFYTPSTGTWTAGPKAHVFEPSKSSLIFPASGGSITFDVEAETTWTASTPTFATLSPSTGGTGTTTVTATCPSYTGTTKREETITFTDNDSFTFDVKIRQRALTNGISNLYLGDNQIPTANAIYLGDAGVNTIYLGEDVVYSSGPFVGLKVSPQSLGLNNLFNTANIKIKSSENWTITDDSGGWLSYSTTTGATGKTVVTVTASTTQADRTATITVRSANYSETISVNDVAISYYDYFRIQNKYFNIPITYSINTKVECDNVGMVTNNGDDYPGLFCIGNEWDRSTISIASLGTPKWIYRFGNVEDTGGISYNYGAKDNLILSKMSFVYTGGWNMISASLLDSSTKPLIIGGRNDTNTDNVIRMMDGYVGDFRIYDNNVLVMELKPTIYNNVCSYYDTIGGVFYPALGPGTISGEMNQ